MSGMPSRLAIAAFWKLSYMSAQDVALFGEGADPPPDSSEPRAKLVMSALLTALRSAWVIWPIFSSSVMLAISWLTRVATGSDGSGYGRWARARPDDRTTGPAVAASRAAADTGGRRGGRVARPPVPETFLPIFTA